jgi:uncharacterized protein
MPRPVHFEIQAADPAAAQAFYETVLGWRFSKWGEMDYWMIYTGDGDPMAGRPHSEPGIDGGLLLREGPPPAEGARTDACTLTVEVGDCDGYVARAVEAGGSLAMEPSDLAGVGRIGYVRDPEGTLLGLLQPEAPAPS